MTHIVHLPEVKESVHLDMKLPFYGQAEVTPEGDEGLLGLELSLSAAVFPGLLSEMPSEEVIEGGERYVS